MAKDTFYQLTTNDDSAVMAYNDGRKQYFDRSVLTPAVQTWLMWHGLKQKLCDGAAMSRDPTTGRSVDTTTKINRMMAIGEMLLAGQTRMESTGGANEGGLLLAALVRLYPAKTREQLVEYLAGRSDAEKTKLRTSSRVAPIIDEIRAERGKASTIDVDALLGELED